MINIKICKKCLKEYSESKKSYYSQSGYLVATTNPPIKFRLNKWSDGIYRRTVWLFCPIYNRDKRCCGGEEIKANQEDPPDNCPYYMEQILTKHELFNLTDLEIHEIVEESKQYRYMRKEKKEEKKKTIWHYMFTSIAVPIGHVLWSLVALKIKFPKDDYRVHLAKFVEDNEIIWEI